ncbi:uncharacterized protein EDB91DRAFT_1064415, partial [Suillus paluster]|uniref:uncharacterized protein n=1 Tax=Suillus paluster TaxID=48578 RepID=UPI001B8660F7
MTKSHSTSDTSACPVLTGPNNFQIWKLRIYTKLCREKVLRVATGEEPKPSPASALTTSASADDPVTTWVLRDDKALGIIQGHISDALLLKTASQATSKGLLDKLIEIHNTSNIASAFYSFEQLFALRWDGASTIEDHISIFQNLETRLTGMKFG